MTLSRFHAAPRGLTRVVGCVCHGVCLVPSQEYRRPATVTFSQQAVNVPHSKLPVPTVGRRSERSRTPFRRSPFGTVAERLLHSGTAVTLVERLLVTSVTSVTTFARNRIHAIHILWQLNSARLSCTPISDPYSRTALTLRTTAQSAVQQNNTYTYIAH